MHVERYLLFAVRSSLVVVTAKRFRRFIIISPGMATAVHDLSLFAIGVNVRVADILAEGLPLAGNGNFANSE